MDKRAIADLLRSGIEPSDAEAAGIFDVSDASTLFPEFKPLPAIVLPYFDAAGDIMTFQREGETHPFCRVRYLEEPPQAGTFFKVKPRRYDQPLGSGTRAYLPLGMDWQTTANDTRVSLCITEGEKKTLATVLAGFNTVGLGGVYNFVCKTTGELLPELDAFKWRGREVFLAFDSDAATNPNIQAAEARLVDELMRARGAKLFLVRLPAEGEEKVGLDDFILANGPSRLAQVFENTESLGGLDAAVVALNRHVALIARDGAIYDITARHFLKTDFFVRGSEYSSITARKVVTTGKSPGVKEVSVAAAWLTHPLARRYADMLFRPGEGPLVQTEAGQPAFNVWHEFYSTPGDVEPFLRLSDYLFSQLPIAARDFALKLFAYKAQNPTEKTFGVVLTGDQGGGKSLWSHAIAAAFKPYACSISSKEFLSDFQGWMERSLLAVVNEAKPGHLEEAGEALKSFITETDHQMNEKFRVKRMVKCFTSFILTANDRGVGSFAHDDRRMFVVNCPPTHPRGRAFYEPIYAWLKADGGAALMHWLLTYDLKGWVPGSKPPNTAEKAMARRENLTEVEQYAEDMRTATEHVICMWLERALDWANRAVGAGNPNLARHAQEIIDSYAAVQVRDWYTPEELTAMFPQVAAALYGSRRTVKTVSGEMSRQLRNAGIRYLECADDPEGFHWRGRRQQFLVVANTSDWATPLTQADFERAMRQAPRYVDVKAALKKAAKGRQT